MTRSMTGFGRATRQLSNGSVVNAEVNTLNHRFMDINMHLPPAWTALESVVKEAVARHVARGRVHVWAKREHVCTSGQVVRLDRTVAEQYISAARELSRMLGTMESLSLDALAALEGVFIQEEPKEDMEATERALVEAVEEALAGLNRMRETEGAALVEELETRVSELREALGAIEARLPEVQEQYKNRLRTRLDELKQDQGIAEERLAVELAILAEKSDVTEETVRFKGHLDHVLQLLERSDPVGRELNFLAQEMQREINTLSAKVRDGDVSGDVLRIKAELEKFREQVQNIE